MADTAIAITAGAGTNVDTRTEATNGNHRQVMVIGDPATNAGVAPVDVTKGLAVDLTATGANATALNVAVTAGSISTLATQATLAAIQTLLTAPTVKYAVIQVSATGTIVAAVASKKIRVLNYVLMANGTVNVKWQSLVIPTDKSGLLYLVANVGVSSGYAEYGHFETISGEALSLNLSAGVAVGGHISYTEV